MGKYLWKESEKIEQEPSSVDISLLDIYQLLEEAIDVCEDVSNIVEGIVLKHG